MLGLSDMDARCVPPMVRCECWAGLSDMDFGCVLPWLYISAKEDEDLHGG